MTQNNPPFALTSLQTTTLFLRRLAHRHIPSTFHPWSHRYADQNTSATSHFSEQYLLFAAVNHHRDTGRGHGGHRTAVLANWTRLQRALSPVASLSPLYPSRSASPESSESEKSHFQQREVWKAAQVSWRKGRFWRYYRGKMDQQDAHARRLGEAVGSRD